VADLVDADLTERVSERLAVLRDRLTRAGEPTVDIVAVTKGFDASAIAAALACGLTKVGENYAQEAVPKVAAARAAGWTAEVHFVGQLQTNKVRALAGTVGVWHSVDRAPLAIEVARRAPGARVFVQVNATGEPGKGGCAPDRVDDLVGVVRGVGLSVAGLMAVGPTSGDAAATRAAFAWTRRTVDRLGLDECSMGMSDDLEIAVAEGATLVRIGTALFGPRSRPG
jgi:PLP dependent protein